MKTKQVKASYTIHRNGGPQRFDLGEISYARLSAVQVALASALVGLAGYGVTRNAQDADGKPGRNFAGNESLRATLDIDHGGNGGSGVEVWYRGISDQDADQVVATLRGAVAAAMA